MPGSRSSATAGPRAAALAVAALAILVRVPLLFDRYDTQFAPDSGLYLRLADRLRAGLNFPDDYRVPGYPTLVALADLLPGRREDMVILVQHALGVGVAAALVLLGWRYFGRLAGIAAGVVAATTPVLLDTEHDVLPDLLFGAAVLGATAVLVAAVARPRVSTRLLVVAALLFALTAYVKPNGQLFAVAAAVPIAYATRSVRRTMALSALFAAVFALAITPWLVRNAVEYGHFSMSAQGGESLYLRVFDQDDRPIPTDTPEGRLAARARARALAQAPHSADITGTYTPVKVALMARGMTSQEATRVQGDLAVTAIRRDPVAYVAGSVRNLGLMWARSFYPRYPIAQLGDKLPAADFPRPVSLALWVLGAGVLAVWLLASLGGLAAALVFVAAPREARVAALTFAWLWLIVAGGIALTNVPAHRLSAQALPLLLLLGSGGIAAGAALLRTRGWRGAAGGPSAPPSSAHAASERTLSA